MMDENETSIDIYSRAKKDFFRPAAGRVNEAEILSVYEKVFSNPRFLSYYSILSFGLLFPCSPENLKRLKELFQIFIETDKINLVIEDRLKAILTAGCIYWAEPALFEDKLKAVLEQWDYDYFPDACITATSSFARLTFSSKSLTRLQYLKEHTLKRMDKAEELELEQLIGGCITAATGERMVRREMTKKYMNKTALQNLSFETTG